MRLIDADALKRDDELTEWITKDAIRTGKMLKSFSELFVKKIDDAPTVNAVSEEVYTEEFNLRKDAEMKAYKLEKALEQEPCNDAISRQAVLDIINSDWKYEGMEQYINELPSVKPQEPFDIETYCKEHFCVMVDKDVWDKVTNRLVKSKAKCKDCIYLSSEKNTVGRLCINPSKIFRTKTSCWKHTTTPACKLFKAR